MLTSVSLTPLPYHMVRIFKSIPGTLHTQEAFLALLAENYSFYIVKRLALRKNFWHITPDKAEGELLHSRPPDSKNLR